MSELALRLIEENKKTRSKFLDLRNCDLTEVPEEIGDLAWLESLFLSGEWWVNDFDIVWEYNRLSQQITRNSGNFNTIKSLPETFQNLSNLKILLLSGSPISDLKVLEKLTSLCLIDCSSTLVFDLSPVIALVKKNIPVFYFERYGSSDIGIYRCQN